MKIKMTRTARIDGKPIFEGATIDIDPTEARAVVQAGKAVALNEGEMRDAEAVESRPEVDEVFEQRNTPTVEALKNRPSKKVGRPKKQ